MKQVRHFFTGILTVLLMVAFTNVAFPQTVVDVAPGFGTLNDAITANTESNVVFRLQRGDGAIYLLNGSVSITTPVTIEAASGSGARPQLIPAIGSGGSSDVPLRPKANVTLKGLYITGQDELAAYKSQIIRVQADDVRLVIDDCFIENSGQSAMRLDNKNTKIYIKNSTIRNCTASDWNNGRGIDDRGNNIDTLYLENNSIYNIASRFLRDGGGYINYVYVNHNTFADMGYRVMDIGECPSVVFTNNIVSNCGFLGKGKTATDALLSINALTSTEFTGMTQTAEVHNNNFYVSSTVSALYSDTVEAVPLYNEQLTAVMTSSGSGSNTISEELTFTSAPPAVDPIVPHYWADAALGSSTTASELLVSGTFDFGYSATAQSYTAATSGQPLGALTWFGIPVGVEDGGAELIPTEFNLSQNYPNPFNPVTTISYRLAKPASVRLTVYNSIGQAVKTLVSTEQATGNYSVQWNGTNESGTHVSSGIYFYRLDADGFVNVKKMILLK